MKKRAPDQLLGEALDAQGPKHSKPSNRKFFAWHKPRKQWVRINQWQKEVENLFSILKFPEVRRIKYLSLPGEDLLDVRVLQKICSKYKVGLKYLGLNDEHSSGELNTNLHIACNEVNAQDGVDRSSYVTKDDFEEIADADSTAYRYVREYGHFDVINLDLCESISPTDDRDPGYYDALSSLANYQIRNRTEPWLLFITSRAGKRDISEKDMRMLANCVHANASTHREFAVALNKLLPDTSVLEKNDSDLKSLSREHYFNLFNIGIGKWLIKLLSSASPQCKVTLLSSYSYSVYARRDMVSLAFLVEPQYHNAVDKTGLSKRTASAVPQFDEKGSAISLLQSIEKIVDVDAILNSDAKLLRDMEDSAEKLLTSARYDAATYRKQLKAWGKTPPKY